MKTTIRSVLKQLYPNPRYSLNAFCVDVGIGAMVAALVCLLKAWLV